MQSAFPGLAAALAMALTTAPSAPVLAQAQTTLCMVNGGLWALMVPARQAQMEAAGFAVAPCDGRDSAIEAYRIEICRYASSIPPKVAAVFEQNHGASPQLLCDLASEVPQ